MRPAFIRLASVFLPCFLLALVVGFGPCFTAGGIAFGASDDRPGFEDERDRLVAILRQARRGPLSDEAFTELRELVDEASVVLDRTDGSAKWDVHDRLRAESVYDGARASDADARR